MAHPVSRLTARLAALVAAGLLVLSGCGAGGPEEQLPTAEQAPDLTLSRELLDDAGSKLALYTVTLPQFREQADTAAGEINRFYRREMEVHEADCESWFSIVSAKNYPDTRINNFTYRLLDAPKGFVSVERTMTLNGGEAHFFTEYFSLVTGWQRSFADLYNCNIRCETVIRDWVETWCREREVPCDELAQLKLAGLTAEFLIDGDSLRLYYDHQVLSPWQDVAVVVEIPLKVLEDYRLN